MSKCYSSPLDVAPQQGACTNLMFNTDAIIIEDSFSFVASV
jgi:hypothetical protein